MSGHWGFPWWVRIFGVTVCWGKRRVWWYRSPEGATWMFGRVQ